MNYIIYDLEFNQKYCKDDKTSNLDFEIIQIGALKINNELDTLSTFNTLVRPILYTQINSFIEILTNITAKKVSSCEIFQMFTKTLLTLLALMSLYYVFGELLTLKNL